MADEVKGVAVGQGFLTSKGELKSREQLSQEAQRASEQATQSEEAAALQPSNGEQFSKAIGSVRERFSSSVSAVATVINTDEQNLKKAAGAVREELAAAKALRAAFKDGDEEQIQKARQRLEKAQERRNDVADEVQESNARLVTERAKNLNVGSQQVGIVRTQAVRLEREAPQKIEDAEDAKQLISKLQSERAEIVQQRKALREVREDVKKVVKKVDESLTQVETRTIRKLAEAEKTATSLSSRITSNGAQALAASRVSESAVRALLD